MRNGRDRLDILYLAITSVVLILAVVVSLYLFPEWRESPARVMVLIVAVAGGVIGLAANFRAAFIRKKDDVALATLDYDSPQHRRNQENICANVRMAWIDGVLGESLTQRVRLEPALDDLPGMLQRPMVVVEGHEPRRRPVDDAHLADLFNNSGRALLILGAPGSGKTFTLLELCRPLLEGAEVDRRRPVPVVLNLSTWAQQQPTLEQWIAGEMWRQYGLNKKVTPVWLAADHLTLLLDGLDEVAAGARDACVRAINTFRESHGAGMVVCSRSADYDELRERLALSRAVEILPLTPAQIDDYLGDERLKLNGVREAIARDDALRELVTTPLMLSIMAVAYGGRPLAELLPLLDNEDARRAHLYDAYIARVFARRPLIGFDDSSAVALRRLRFIAAQLTKREETQFFIEDMQPDWLPGRWRYWFGGLVIVIFGGMAGGLVGVLLGGLRGVLGGILVGGMIGIGDIEPVDELTLDFSSQAIGRAAKDNLLRGALFGVLGGVLYGGLLGMLSGVLFGLVAGVLVDLMHPLQSKRREQPNQGIRHSAVNALRGSLLFSMLGSLLLGGLASGLTSGLGRVLIGGLGGLLGGGLMYGGAAVIKHYSLRLLLALLGLLPLRLVPFLEAMRERILLQRAGGHYRFIHRTLQEHIAAMTDGQIDELQSTSQT